MIINYRCVVIYTDCQAIVDLITDALVLVPQGLGLFHQYQTLWGLIVRHIRVRQPGDITIRKTKAHNEQNVTTDANLKWQAQCNAKVDSHAKLAITHNHYALHSRLEKIYNRQIEMREQMKQLASYIAEASEFSCASAQKKKICANEVNWNGQILVQPRAGVAYKVNLTNDMLLSFPWGPIYLWRIQKWASNLNWAAPGAGDDRGYTDISYIELYLDFALYMKTLVPRNIATTNPANWILDDLELRVDCMNNRTLAQQTLVWTKSIKWIHANKPKLLWPAEDVDRSHSLNMLGCSSWLRAIRPRPKLTTGDQAARKVNDFFTSNGTLVSRAMNRGIDLLVRPNREHPRNSRRTLQIESLL